MLCLRDMGCSTAWSCCSLEPHSHHLYSAGRRREYGEGSLPTADTPMVKTLYCHCRGYGFNPWLDNTFLYIKKKKIDTAIYYKGNWPRFLSSFLLLVGEEGPTENMLGERQ